MARREHQQLFIVISRRKYSQSLKNVETGNPQMTTRIAKIRKGLPHDISLCQCCSVCEKSGAAVGLRREASRRAARTAKIRATRPEPPAPCGDFTARVDPPVQ